MPARPWIVQFIVPPVPDSYARNVFHFVRVSYWWHSPPWSHKKPARRWARSSSSTRPANGSELESNTHPYPHLSFVGFNFCKRFPSRVYCLGVFPEWNTHSPDRTRRLQVPGTSGRSFRVFNDRQQSSHLGLLLRERTLEFFRSHWRSDYRGNWRKVSASPGAIPCSVGPNILFAPDHKSSPFRPSQLRNTRGARSCLTPSPPTFAHSLQNLPRFLSPSSTGTKSGTPPKMVRFLVPGWDSWMDILNGCCRGQCDAILDLARRLHQWSSFQAPGNRRARTAQHLHRAKTRIPPSLLYRYRAHPPHVRIRTRFQADWAEDDLGGAKYEHDVQLYRLPRRFDVVSM